MKTTHPLRCWAAFGAVAGAVALAGCGSQQDTATTATPARKAAATATRAASVPAALRGSWKRTMRARDWKAAGSGYPVGTWRFDVAPDGGVGVYYPRKRSVDFTTQYAVAGRQLTIDSIPVCPGQTARYAWRASASTLSLTAVGHDPCVQRVALFGGTWHRRR